MYGYRLHNVLTSFIDLIFGLIILGLGIRFFLRLFGANPASDFTEFIYNSTSPLLEPFDGLFKPYVIEPGNVFEFTTLFAIAMYFLAAWLLTELIAYIVYTGSNTYRRRP